MSKAKRILIGDGGLAATIGTLVFIGVGLAFVSMGLADLTEALRTQPVPQDCREFLAAPGSTARWVSLSGCRLDLPLAATRRWKAWRPGQPRDGGASGKTLELFIPLSAKDAPPAERPSAIVATTDKRLLELMDTLQRLESPEQVEAFIVEHQAELEQPLAPQTLVGYVEPIASIASHAALGVLTAQGAVVLEQGRQPARLNSVWSVMMGMGLMIWGLLPVARRWRLERESETV